MRTRGILVAAVLLAILFGCAQDESARAPQEATNAQQPDFAVPQSAMDYTAQYAVSDSGSETYKTVYCSGTKMRVDLQIGASEVRVYLLTDRAYSCSTSGTGFVCFDITSKMASGGYSDFCQLPDLSGAEELENVDIGGTTGRCYLQPYATFGSRKRCFTDRGVLAYDEYNATAGETHTEYLADLFYGVQQSDFDLPAIPSAAPN